MTKMELDPALVETWGPEPQPPYDPKKALRRMKSNRRRIPLRDRVEGFLMRALLRTPLAWMVDTLPVRPSFKRNAFFLWAMPRRDAARCDCTIRLANIGTQYAVFTASLPSGPMEYGGQLLLISKRGVKVLADWRRK